MTEEQKNKYELCQMKIPFIYWIRKDREATYRKNQVDEKSEDTNNEKAIVTM